MRRSLVTFGLLCLSAAPLHAGDVGGRVSMDGRAVADAVVYLEGDARDFPEPATVAMDQKNLAFVPKVLPVQRGTTVRFTNSDDIQHNVFSPSPAGPFDLGTHGPGEGSIVKLEQVGEIVVLCNIHMEMQGRIVVLPQPYFALSDSAGGYRIADVPAGNYTLKLWNGRFLKQATPIVVSAEGELTVDLRAGE